MGFEVFEDIKMEGYDLRKIKKHIDIGIKSLCAKTPDKNYLIKNQGEPFLVINAYVGYPSVPPTFDKTYFWQGFICIALGEAFYCINLTTFGVITYDLQWYCCDIFEYNEYLFVSSATSLYCLGIGCNLIWRNDNLGVDGVLISGMKDHYLEISGEFDPPGGWVGQKVDIITGKRI